MSDRLAIHLVPMTGDYDFMLAAVRGREVVETLVFGGVVSTIYGDRAALEGAAKTMAERIELSEEEFERFMDALDRPDPPSRYLAELAQRKPLWERNV